MIWLKKNMPPLPWLILIPTSKPLLIKGAGQLAMLRFPIQATEMYLQLLSLCPLLPLPMPYSLISEVHCPSWSVWDLHSFTSFLQLPKPWVSESMNSNVFHPIPLKDLQAKAMCRQPTALFMSMILAIFTCFDFLKTYTIKILWSPPPIMITQSFVFIFTPARLV